MSIQPSKCNEQSDMAHTSIDYKLQAFNYPPLLLSIVVMKALVQDDEFGFFGVKKMELIFYILCTSGEYNDTQNYYTYLFIRI